MRGGSKNGWDGSGRLGWRVSGTSKIMTRMLDWSHVGSRSSVLALRRWFYDGR